MWISVKDSLPMHDENVLAVIEVKGEKRFVERCHFINYTGENPVFITPWGDMGEGINVYKNGHFTRGWKSHYRVAHWMPLPELPAVTP